MTTVNEMMKNYGAAVVDFAEAFGLEQWQKLKAAYADFLQSDRYLAQLKNFKENPPAPEVDNLEKRYLLRLLGGLGDAPIDLAPDDPWLEFSQHPILQDLARDYFQGGDPALAYFDLWRTEPMAERPRVGSQNWHVDYEAGGYPRRIFKAFLYFSDALDEGAGPLEIRGFTGSSAGGFHSHIFVRAGSMVFIDTGRLVHRGGYCTTQPRSLAVWYFTNASPVTVPPLVLKPRHKVIERSAR
jgi:hypothetical protein